MPLRWRTHRAQRVLDFDCEARPLAWISQDFVSKEPTAIAAKFIGDPEPPHVWLIGRDGVWRESDVVLMLEGFRDMYREADVVTGHYIRGYDLTLLNGAMLEMGLPPLGPKLAHDTKQDLVKRSGLSSSQENLGAMLGLEHPKVQMDQAKWRAANRLTPEGVALTRERVVGDVEQHIELRARLLERGFLGPPKLWDPGSARDGGYLP